MFILFWTFIECSPLKVASSIISLNQLLILNINEIIDTMIIILFILFISTFIEKWNNITNESNILNIEIAVPIGHIEFSTKWNEYDNLSPVE